MLRLKITHNNNCCEGCYHVSPIFISFKKIIILVPIAVPLSTFTNQNHILHFQNAKYQHADHSELKNQSKWFSGLLVKKDSEVWLRADVGCQWSANLEAQNVGSCGVYLMQEKWYWISMSPPLQYKLTLNIKMK